MCTIFINIVLSIYANRRDGTTLMAKLLMTRFTPAGALNISDIKPDHKDCDDDDQKLILARIFENENSCHVVHQ